MKTLYFGCGYSLQSIMKGEPGRKPCYVHGMFGPLLRFLCLFFAVLALVACDFRQDEKLVASASSQNPQLTEVHIGFPVRTHIEQTKVKPTRARRLLRDLLGWIPFVRELVELPMNLVNFLIPPIPVRDGTPLPGEGEVFSPEVADMVKSIELDSLTLFVTKTPLDPQDIEACYAHGKCPRGDIDFLRSFKVFIVDGEHKESTLLAEGEYEKGSAGQLRLIGVDNINLMPYLLEPNHFSIETVARGRPSREKVYINGFIDLFVKMRIPLQ